MLVTGCDANLLNRPSALERWRAALMRADYAAAEQFMIGEGVAEWLNETKQLTQQHGSITSYGRSDGLTLDSTMRIARIELPWHDGTAQCFRVRETNTSLVELLDNQYQNCTALEKADPAYHPPPD